MSLAKKFSENKTKPESPVTLENVDKFLQGEKILDSVSFSLPRGKISALIGPNGAGKTTTIRIILGLLSPSSGQVKLLGQKPTLEKKFSKIGIVMENNHLWEKYRGQENIRMYARLWGIKEKNVATYLDEIAGKLGMAEALSKPVHTYSKGMRRKLSLLIALIKKPEFLICDELTSGIDPASRVDMRNFLLEFCSQGKTVFFTSHDLDEVQKLSHRIIFLNRGRLIIQGNKEELQNVSRTRTELYPPAGKSPEDYKDILQEKELSFEAGKKKIVFYAEKQKTAEKIASNLVRKGCTLKKMQQEQQTLENLFLDLVKGKEADNNARETNKT